MAEINSSFPHVAMNKLPPSDPDSFSDAASEEVAAPHLAASGACEEDEVWTPAPIIPVGSVRALSEEEKWPGEWHAVAWMYAHGTSQKQIARELDYSESQISVILQKPRVHEKIEAIRKEFLGTESLVKKFAGIAAPAAEYMEKVIRGSEGAKTGERIQASQWMLEKVTGKAKQEGVTDGGTTILQLLQALEAVKEARASGAESPRDVTLPGDIMLEAAKPKDALADWVTQHVPDSAEGGMK